jgi:hypothetical protein
MIAETANLTTARNVVKEAAGDRTFKKADCIQLFAEGDIKLMSRQEQSKFDRCLIRCLSVEVIRAANLKLPANEGPR